MSTHRITPSRPTTNLSPANRREQREIAEAEAMAEIASVAIERQRKSAELRKLRLAQTKQNAKG